MEEPRQATTITVERQGRNAIAHVSGELDAAAAPEFEKSVLAALQDGVSLCVVDLTEATFIDSVGVASMIRSHRSAEECGSRIALAGAHGMIAQLLTVTQLTRVIPAFPTLEEALQAAPKSDG